MGRRGRKERENKRTGMERKRQVRRVSEKDKEGWEEARDLPAYFQPPYPHGNLLIKLYR